MPDDLTEAMRALRLALQILDDDLQSYRSDTPPSAYDARGFVCLDDLSDCPHRRWKECEATLTVMAAIRDLLPAEEWEETTYETSQRAVEHFAPAGRSILAKGLGNG
jgi:hypothetical protein